MGQFSYSGYGEVDRQHLEGEVLHPDERAHAVA